MFGWIAYIRCALEQRLLRLRFLGEQGAYVSYALKGIFRLYIKHVCLYQSIFDSL